MTWADSPVLGFDLETTGVNHDDDRIATACAAVIHNGTVTYQRNWMIAIDVDMPTAAAAVNGLSTDKLRAEGRPAAQVIPEIVGALRYAVSRGMPIVAFNAAFDITFTDREARRWIGQALGEALGTPVRPVLDPYVIWKEVVPRRSGKRRLTDACTAFRVPLGDNAHQADADAIAAVRVLLRLAKAFPRIAAMNAGALHEAQVGWRREQCDSLRGYFDREGIAHDGVPGEWPLIPAAVMAR